MGCYVADRIRQLIVQKGLLQKFVANAAGFSNQQFSDMLNGRKIIRVEYLPQIAQALGVEIADLFPSEPLNR